MQQYCSIKNTWSTRTRQFLFQVKLVWLGKRSKLSWLSINIWHGFNLCQLRFDVITKFPVHMLSSKSSIWGVNIIVKDFSTNLKIKNNFKIQNNNQVSPLLLVCSRVRFLLWNYQKSEFQFPTHVIRFFLTFPFNRTPFPWEIFYTASYQNHLVIRNFQFYKKKKETESLKVSWARVFFWNPL